MNLIWTIFIFYVLEYYLNDEALGESPRAPFIERALS